MFPGVQNYRFLVMCIPYGIFKEVLTSKLFPHCVLFIHVHSRSERPAIKQSSVQRDDCLCYDVSSVVMCYFNSEVHTVKL
jgi:hypothetical protein